MTFDITEHPILLGFCMIISILVFIFLMMVLLQFISVNYDNIPIEVYVKGNLVYNGINACVDVNSAGDTTKITINNGFLCMFPEKTYTGRDIEIRGAK